MRKKLSSSRGLTLTETLVALMITALVSAAVAVGVTGSIQVYRSAVEFSDYHVLFSTLSQAVTDELRYARDISLTELPDGTHQVDSYTSASYGPGCHFDTSPTAEQVTVINGAGDSFRLVGDGVYSQGAFKATVSEVKMDKGIFTVDLKVTSGDDRFLKNRTIAVTALNHPA